MCLVVIGSELQEMSSWGSEWNTRKTKEWQIFFMEHQIKAKTPLNIAPTQCWKKELRQLNQKLVNVGGAIFGHFGGLGQKSTGILRIDLFIANLLWCYTWISSYPASLNCWLFLLAHVLIGRSCHSKYYVWACNPNPNFTLCHVTLNLNNMFSSEIIQVRSLLCVLQRRPCNWAIWDDLSHVHNKGIQKSTKQKSKIKIYFLVLTHPWKNTQEIIK